MPVRARSGTMCPEHRYHDAIDLDHDQADDGEEREVDAQVAQPVLELVPAVRRFQLAFEPQSVKPALQLFRQRRGVRSAHVDAARFRPAILQYSAPRTRRTASSRGPRRRAAPRATPRPPRAVPRAGRRSAGTARGSSRDASATSTARLRRTTCPGGACSSSRRADGSSAKSASFARWNASAAEYGVDASPASSNSQMPCIWSRISPAQSVSASGPGSFHSTSPGSRPRLATSTWFASYFSDSSRDSGALSRSRQSAAKASRKSSLRWLTPTGS